MSFSFNFQEETDVETTVSLKSLSLQQNSSKTENLTAGKLKFKDEEVEIVAETVNPWNIYRRDLSDVLIDLAHQDDQEDAQGIAQALAEKSDLLSGVYEGGVKTWECSLDLLENLKSSLSSIKDKRVLELGCGSALPGIYCLVNGAKSVDFQDFNQLVLQMVTLPNVLLNTTQRPNPNDVASDGTFETTLKLASTKKTKYWWGDWSALTKLLPSGEFDVILTSETIYNSEYHSRLLDLIEHCLSPDGICLVAAKATYFGCSGTLFDFQALIKQRNKMSIKSIKVFSANSGIRREIVQLSWT